jgi:hypothetical protein
MFVRKKKNPSGVVSIQIVDKSKGQYKVLKTTGSSSEAKEVASLYISGKQWISECTSVPHFAGKKYHQFVDNSSPCIEY